MRSEMAEDVSNDKKSEDAITLKGIQTIFGDVQGQKIVFCIDTSGSTYETLPTIKEHLTETLVRMAYQAEKRSFNLIQFNSQVCQWSDNIVPCTPETVHLAVKWIRCFESTSGANMLDALLCAFENDCDSVYLVTDSCPDQEKDSICDHISYIGKGRPLNCIYVAKETPDKSVWDFLDELASLTHGSFNVVNISRHGVMERVTPIHKGTYNSQVIRTNEGSVYPNLSNCSITNCLNGDPLNDPVFVAPNFVVSPATGQPVPYYHPHNHWFWWGAPVPGAYGPHIYNPFYSWSRYKAARAFVYGKDKLKETNDDTNLCPTASALLIGRRVLARCMESGQFHIGKVKSETYGRRFLIQFDAKGGEKYDDIGFQDTCLDDIIAYDDAFRHPILPGDRVLVPKNTENPTRYILATVMEGSEPRSEKVNEGSPTITISYTTGKMESIPTGFALWIPNSLYHRISLEEKMPKEALQNLRETPGYPLISLPGYPTREDKRSPQEYEQIKPFYTKGVNLQVDHMLPPYYLPVAPTYETCYQNELHEYSTMEAEINKKKVRGHEMTVAELEEKVEKQLRSIKIPRGRKEKSNHNENDAEETNNDSQCIENPVDTKNGNSKVSWDELHYSENEELNEKQLDVDAAETDIENYFKNRPDSRRRSKSPEIKRPPWRHFGKDTIPEMLERKEHEPYEGIRGTSCMETRPIKHIGGAVEWPGSSFGIGDPQSRTRYDREVLLDLLSRSHNKSRNSAWHSSGPLGDLTKQLGRHEIPRQQENLDRDDFRRERVINREELRQARLRDREVLDTKAERYRQDKHSTQLERMRQRQLHDEEALARQRDYKRVVAEHIRGKVEDVSMRDADKDVKRVELIRQRREERESAMKSLDERVQANRHRLEVLHQQRDAARWEGVHNRLQAEEKKFKAQDLVAREIERNRRIAHRQREECNQRKLELKEYAAQQNAPPLA